MELRHQQAVAKPNAGSGKVSKAQAIRDELAENPKAGCKEIIARIAAKGIKVSAAMVYYVNSPTTSASRPRPRDATGARWLIRRSCWGWVSS